MKMRLTQFILLGALVLLVIQIVLIAPSQIRDESKASKKDASEESVGSVDSLDQNMSGMHMIETQEGRKEWELWSENAKSIRLKDISELHQVKALFYTSSGATFTVTGKKGIVKLKSKDMRIEGDVVVRSSNDYVFKTSSLDYNSASRELTTEAAIEMLGPKEESGHSLSLTGVGLRALMNEASMQVSHEVKAVRKLDSGKKALIRSNSALFSGKYRMAKFLGNVILDMDSMRITGPEAEFAYDPKRDKLKSVFFTGGAKVSDSDKWATAQNLRVDFETNKFIFRGAPRVVQNNDELRGEEIVFLDGGKRVQVIKARAKVDENRLERVN